MSGKFHVTDEGVVKQCNAASSETCKYGDDAIHGSSREEAIKLYEAHMSGNLFVGHSAVKADSDDEVFDAWGGYNRKHYTVPAGNFDAAMKRIDAANRRLARNGIEDSFEVTYTKRYVSFEEKDRDTGLIIQKANLYYDIELNSPKLSYDGYEFLAVMSAEGKGFIVRGRGDVELGGERPDSMYCEHCGHNRRRAKTYLIQSPNGEVKQIGSTCVEAYLGIKPEGLWALEYDSVNDFTEGGKSYGGFIDDAPKYTHIDSTLAAALAVSDEGQNYRPTSFNQHSTSADVDDVLYNGKNVNQEWRKEQLEKMEKIKESGKVEQLKEMIRNLDGNSDYAANLKAAVSEEYASARSSSIIVSAVSIIAREERAKKWVEEKDRRAKEEADRKSMFTAGHVGKPEDKLKNVSYEFISARAYETFDYYGNSVTKYTTTMRDSDGKQLTFFASEDLTNHKDEDGKITFTSGRVKSHGEYEGIDQTVLSHMRVKKKK